ncbi:flavodoxin family protein [Murdochiella sp. Marseille-P8839]|nr:flavodoxin family protein [Murdochiella sp. Marseille-P8839]
MKFVVAYRSLTGCTKKLAEAIYESIDEGEKELLDIKERPDISDADIVALGYYVIQGGPDDLVKDWIKQVKGKRVFLFCTLAYFADSKHAFDSMQSAIDLVEEAGGEVLGNFIANGALAPGLIERFKKMARENPDNPHAYTEEKGIRYEIFKDHPSQKECDLAVERFHERVLLSQRIRKLKEQ